MNRGKALENLDLPFGYRLHLHFPKGKASKKKVRLGHLVKVRGERSEGFLEAQLIIRSVFHAFNE